MPPPTDTPVPTEIPVPTATPIPTDTPQPATPTPVPPLPTETPTPTSESRDVPVGTLSRQLPFANPGEDVCEIDLTTTNLACNPQTYGTMSRLRSRRPRVMPGWRCRSTTAQPGQPTWTDSADGIF